LVLCIHLLIWKSLNCQVARIKKPKEVELPPALPKVAKLTNDDPVGPTIWPSYNPPVVKGGGNLPIDNQLVIAIGFPPEYPNGALTRGIEGYAVVGFSVSAAGSVFDSYILESEPTSSKGKWAAC